jgi:acetyl-CoA acetyltransferase
MNTDVYVVGVGMTKFHKPGAVLDLDYTTMVQEAGSKALDDAAITLEDVGAGFAAYVRGESCSGHRAIYALGTTGMPIFNVTSNCSSGSSALNLAIQAIRAGATSTALCVGFEKMSGPMVWLDDRTYPCDLHIMAGTHQYPLQPEISWSVQTFANAGREHMDLYGSTPEHFAQVAVKNRRHAAANPYAQFQQENTLQEILDSPVIYEPLTRLQCSPPSTGAAAVVVMSGEEVRHRGLEDRAVRVLGQGVATDQADSFDPPSAIMSVGYGMSRRAAASAFDQAGVSISDVDVIELHDCYSPNEILTYEALGLAGQGKGHLLIENDETTFGGRVVVNPSGGLIGKGHPMGATGLAQCTELVWQLRREADGRQVDGAAVALQHNIGLGGTAVVTIYGAPDGSRG